MLSYQAHLWQLYLAYGIMMGLGMGMGGMLPMMTIINNWFVMKRSVALSVSMASMGLAGTVILPSLAKLINIIGWRNSYRMTAAVVFVLCVVIPALLIRNKPEELGQVTDGHAGEKSDSLKPKSSLYRNLYRTPVEFTAREALRTRVLWLLTAYGMLQFLLLGGLTTHQIAYLSDIGISLEKAAVAGGVMSAVMAISQLGVGFLGLRFRMQSLAIVSAAVGIMGFAILLYARSMPLVLSYNVMIGMGFGIQSIAMGNLIPDYFGRSEFPKIMGYTMPFVTILSSFGASIAGFVRDATGSFIPAFQIFLALMFVAFFCILFAKPPKHPSLESRIAQIESVKSV
jgi:MFS family permease